MHGSLLETVHGVLLSCAALSFSSALQGCESEPEGSSAGSSYVESDKGSGITLEGGEITTEFGPEVSHRSHFVLGAGENSARETTVNGLPFGFAAGVLRWGGARFGGPVVGDRVLVTEDAILVNGTKRWDSPLR